MAEETAPMSAVGDAATAASATENAGGGEHEAPNVETLVERAVGKHIQKLQSDLSKQLPGMVKRLSLTALESRSKAAPAKKEGDAEPDANQSGEREKTNPEVAILRRELEAMKQKQADVEQRESVLNALSGVEFLKKAEGAMREIFNSRVERTEEGTLVYKHSSGEYYSLEEGAKVFAEENEYAVKAPSKGGSGATGKSRAASSVPAGITYAQITADPTLLGQMQRENPELLAKLKEAHYAGKAIRPMVAKGHTVGMLPA